MLLRWLTSILILPGSVLVGIPTLLIWLTGGTKLSANFCGWTDWKFVLAALLAIPGATLSFAAMAMFLKFGNGTPAPWDPPRKFVVKGVYRWVRNPMLSGVIMMLIAMSLLLQSWPVGIWAALFFISNTLYFRLSEEPGLEMRFGEDYRRYCENVNRWWPRFSPWDPS